MKEFLDYLIGKHVCVVGESDYEHEYAHSGTLSPKFHHYLVGRKIFFPEDVNRIIILQRGITIILND